jgi:hypothetical protein
MLVESLKCAKFSSFLSTYSAITYHTLSISLFVFYIAV